jgi:hypothetical protein
MNLYAVIGSGLGTPDAVSLGVRLSAWHDAMVAHERRLRSTSSKDGCHDECPHAEARALWAEAVETFGQRAHELTFLQSRGHKTHRGSHRGTPAGRMTVTTDHATSREEGAPL